MKKKKQPKAIETSAQTLRKKRRRIAPLSNKSVDDGWERLMKIREKLRKGGQNEKSAVEILSEMRR